MNERIENLFKQATGRNELLVGVDRIHRLELERFAELIVKECVGVINEVYNCSGQGDWYEGYLSGVAECKRKTEEHFGVD